MNHSVILYNINVISIISVYSRKHLKDIDSFINKHISKHIKDKTYRSYRLIKVPIFLAGLFILSAQNVNLSPKLFILHTWKRIL